MYFPHVHRQFWFVDQPPARGRPALQPEPLLLRGIRHCLPVWCEDIFAAQVDWLTRVTVFLKEVMNGFCGDF